MDNQLKSALFQGLRKVCAPCSYLRRSRGAQMMVVLTIVITSASFATRAGTKRKLRRDMRGELASVQRWIDPISHIIHGNRPRNATETHCANNTELFPGEVHDPFTNGSYHWEPAASCTLKRFDTAEAAACVYGQKVAFFGDSLTDDLSRGFMEKIGDSIEATTKERIRHSRVNTEGSAVGSFHWTHSAFALDPTDAVERPNASKALSAADVVVLHHSTWDMGTSCKGLLPFYDALKARLLKVRAAMKPTSRLLLYDLHWIFHRRCLAKGGPHKMCFKCNNPQRVRAYRAALRLAAACTGTEFFSTAEVYKQMPAHTNDGIHYDRSLWTMESNVLLNGLCMRDGAPPMRFNNPVTCVGEAKGGEEAAQLQRWQAELSPDVLGCDCLLANQMQNSTVKSSKVR